MRGVEAFWVGEALPRYHALLHGSVLGVPVGDTLPAADDRPDPAGLTVALGSDVDDVVAALGADGIGLGETERRAAEDLMAAFSNGLIAEMGGPDGVDALGAREHENGFWSLPGTPVAGRGPGPAAPRGQPGREPAHRRAARAGPPAAPTPRRCRCWPGATKTDLVAKGGRKGRTNPSVGRVAPESKPAAHPALGDPARAPRSSGRRRW